MNDGTDDNQQQGDAPAGDSSADGDSQQPQNLGDIDDQPQNLGDIDDQPQNLGDIDDLPPPSDSCPTCDAGSDGDAARGDASTNTVAAGDRSACLPQGQIQKCTLPPARQLTATESLLIQAAVAAVQVAVVVNPVLGPYGPVFALAKNFANSMGCTVALGVGGDLIGMAGGSGGGGVYWDPNGQVGAYGSVAIDAGFAITASIGIVITIIKGGADAFGGDSYALGGGGGEGVSVSGFILFDSNGHFYGISESGSIGGGMPFGAYGQLSHTWITPPTG